MCIQGRPIKKALYSCCAHALKTDRDFPIHAEFCSCHPPSVRKGFIKGEALRLLRTNSAKPKFDEHIALFKQRLQHRGFPDNLLNRTLSEVNFSQRMSALQNKQKRRKRILPFVTEYRPSMPDLKNILVNKWHLIQNLFPYRYTTYSAGGVLLKYAFYMQ